MWERDGHVCVDLHAHSKGVMLVREKHEPPTHPPGSSNLSAPSLMHTEVIYKAQVGSDCWQGSEIQSRTRLAKGSLEHPRRAEDPGWWIFPNTRSRKKEQGTESTKLIPRLNVTVALPDSGIRKMGTSNELCHRANLEIEGPITTSTSGAVRVGQILLSPS